MFLFVLFIQILFIFILTVHCENCSNIQTDIIWPSLFREGIWYDQIHIYSNASPLDSVSLFATTFHTNCGYYDLKAKSMDTLEMYKGFYIERFDEHLFTFMVNIEAAYKHILLNIFLEKKLCDLYENIKLASQEVNILMTDYVSFMILHQCINDENYVMVLTKNEDYISENDDKIGIEHAIVDIIMQYNITIPNRKFIWSSKNFCRHNMENIYKNFYRRKYIDRVQVECSTNITIQTIELEDYWWHKMDMRDKRMESVRKRLIAIAFFLLAIVSILFVVYVFNSNFQCY